MGGGTHGSTTSSVNLFIRCISSSAPKSVLFIRLAVGLVFFFEGVLKFLYPAELGAGRFAKIGIPMPEITGPFVGGVETLFGALLLAGLLTRLAAVPLLINISVAILSTKIPILLGYGFWTFTLTKLPRYGLLEMVHEARTDFSMFCGLIFLVLVGAGGWSLDAWLAKGISHRHASEDVDRPANLNPLTKTRPL
jgi:putative oxidoreductase